MDDHEQGESIISDDDEKLFVGEENDRNTSPFKLNLLDNPNENLEMMNSEEITSNSASPSTIKVSSDSSWWSGIDGLLSSLKKSDFITPLVLTGLLSFVAGSVLSFSFSNLKTRQTHHEMNSRMLNKEIQISKAASQHNISLNKQKEYFETQFNIQSRNLNLANQQIEKHEETISKCREKIEHLEKQIENFKKDIIKFEEDLNMKQHNITDLNLKINQLENQVLENEKVIDKQKQRIVNLKETHRIFEYVLTKASPQLAERIINQIHRVQNIEDESDGNSYVKIPDNNKEVKPETNEK
ncbi:hypothetical protein C9374_006386 [Naegleria lovaniensis]|uniref:Uncharacterized protein n=1 Tax=Naegleria lovaniensis TaxID=51637 RepID=A0AA88GNB9_NAELO|nr:uncharacterized protein C9374_006386 [Naegleria lovaniensis]KAG2381397.1 hypothetical protein C9374_006386 [Naegleria lovaniensis]